MDYFFSFSFGAFFPSWSRRSSSFALFFFLGDHFRSSGSSLSFRCNWFFLNHRRHHGEGRQIDLHFWRYTLWKLNVADVNGIANIQLRNIHCNPVRQIGWQTLNRQCAQALLE